MVQLSFIGILYLLPENMEIFPGRKEGSSKENQFVNFQGKFLF